MIDEKVKELLDFLKTSYSFIEKAKGVGRKNSEGNVYKDEDYIGIDDKREGLAYVRYFGDEDYTLSANDKRHTSDVQYTLTSSLRLIICHKLKKADELCWKILNDITSRDFNATFIVTSVDSEKTRILESETDGGEDNANESVKLIAFNITMSYDFIPCDDITFKQC